APGPLSLPPKVPAAPRAPRPVATPRPSRTRQPPSKGKPALARQSPRPVHQGSTDRPRYPLHHRHRTTRHTRKTAGQSLKTCDRHHQKSTVKTPTKHRKIIKTDVN